MLWILQTCGAVYGACWEKPPHCFVCLSGGGHFSCCRREDWGRECDGKHPSKGDVESKEKEVVEEVTGRKSQDHVDKEEILHWKDGVDRQDEASVWKDNLNSPNQPPDIKSAEIFVR